MKIFCVGRNYAQHAKELNNPIPEEPVIFMKAQSSILKTGRSLYYPKFSKDIHFEGELVIRISKNGKNIQEKFAHKYIHSYTLGIDFTARDIQQELKEKGLPWELAKSFDGAAGMGKFLPFQGLDILNDTAFQIFKNAKLVQEGKASEMLFSIPKIISFISKYFTLQKGDFIYTGTPAGVGPIAIGDTITGSMDGQELLNIQIK